MLRPIEMAVVVNGCNMILSYLDESGTPFKRVTVEGVEKFNISKNGLSYWKGKHIFYLPFYRVGDVRIYETN